MVDHHFPKLHVKLTASSVNVHHQTASASIERTRQLTISTLVLPFPCFCTVVISHMKLDTRPSRFLRATLNNCRSSLETRLGLLINLRLRFRVLVCYHLYFAMDIRYDVLFCCSCYYAGSGTNSINKLSFLG